MNKMFHLAFLLDKDGNNSINLITFDNLNKLDDFIIKHFKNTNDVRKMYDKKISEFCLSNIKFIKEDNQKHKRNWTGSIVIIAEERDNMDKVTFFHKIKVIYQDDKKMLSKKECLTKIAKELEKNSVIEELKLRKKYLLSQNEIDLINKNNTRSDNIYKKQFIGNFITRLKHMEDDLLYYYCRSLINVCHLNEKTVYTSFGTINNIDFDMPINTTLKNKPEAYSNDVYFNNLIYEENDEELFKIYDLDEIDKNSNYLMKGSK